MSTAREVKQFDGNAIGWIDIEDDAGKVHRYRKRAVIANKEVEINQYFYLGVYEVTQEEWDKLMGTLAFSRALDNTRML
jgi:hypothetical protein